MQKSVDICKISYVKHVLSIVPLGIYITRVYIYSSMHILH